MKKIKNKQAIFFLIIGLLGIVLIDNLPFNSKLIDSFLGSSSTQTFKNYEKFADPNNLKYIKKSFADDYNPEIMTSTSFTITEPSFNQIYSKNAVSINLTTTEFYAKTKSKKLLTIRCENKKNIHYQSRSKQDVEINFIDTLLPSIIYHNTQVLLQRANLLNILKDQLSDIKLSHYKKYMISRFSKKERAYIKKKYIQKSKFQKSNIHSLGSLKDFSLITNKFIDSELDFSIFPKTITKKEQNYLNKVNLKKYALKNNKHIQYIKRLAYKNSLTRLAYINNTDLLLTMLIASVDTIPVSLFLAQAKEESAMGRSKAAYELNNLFGTQIPPTKQFNPKYMGRVCGSGSVRLRKFNNISDTIKFQLEVYNVNKPMLLIKNNRFLLRLKDPNYQIKGIEIIDKMPAYAEKEGYFQRVKKDLSYFQDFKGNEFIDYKRALKLIL